MNPILLLEINEIPWKLLTRYRGQEKYKHLEKFFANASTFTSLTVDEGELSPWVTWPSLHRGLSNREHGICNLGQDPATFRGTPIWEEFRKKGASIGIFGSLQSWPPIDPGPNGFFVPDTFAHDEKCIPNYIEPIQRFNLDQVAGNGRVVSSNPLKTALNPKFIFALFRSGVRISTMLRLALQLIREKIDKNAVARRPIFQTVLFWDVFRKLFDAKTAPAFTTFFTNHVASVMHRYWHHLFPEEFPENMRPKELVHQQTMDFAFSVLEEILKDVARWMKENPKLTVVFATSMGQDKVIRNTHTGFEVSVNDVPKLMQALGVASYKKLLAMAPQSSVEIQDLSVRKSVANDLEKITSVSGTKLFSVEEIGPSLSITVNVLSAADCRSGMVKLSDGRQLSLTDIGLRAWQVEAGTGYHIPEGILAVRGPGAKLFRELAGEGKIPADKIKEKLLKIAGI